VTRIGSLLSATVMSAALLPTTAQAQMTIDASKITCEQFVLSKVGNPRTIAAWLSGFYNGKLDNRILDPQGFEEKLTKLESFCYQANNAKLPVMKVVEELFGAGK
jgi:acid stress chaperone HdeB